ncbi:MAG: hypothetical protein HXX09_09625 [Bacteroidetes bacterium]|nr:hypothetical protein [Bacteroidota bacterium]
MFLINLFVAFLVVIASIIPFLKPKGVGIIVFISIILGSALSGYFAVNSLIGSQIEFIFSGSQVTGPIPIRIDALSAWFIMIINFIFLTGGFYGIFYMKAYREQKSNIQLHGISFVLLYFALIGLCVVQNSIVFLILWEIMSISSMLLVIFDHNNPITFKAGINYLVQMHICVILLTIGFIWVYFQKGSFDFNAIPIFFAGNANIGLFLIFFIGFGFKAGFIPFHSWLPLAHPAGPSHVSGIMSGVMVKIGIFGIIRIASYLKSDLILLGEIVVTVSVLTGLFGILNAAVHRDFKRMLAYCTIENIGIIGIGIGIGMMGMGNGSPLLYYLGFGGALLHVLNHALFKSLLFYSAGSIYQQTHTRNIERLGGLIKFMPKTAIIFLIGAIAIGGIPPFNGFVSEFVIYSGLLEGMKSNSVSQLSLLILSFAGLSIIGGLSILTFTKTFGTIFLGNQREKLEHPPKEVSFSMLLPQYLIIAAMLSVAFFPKMYLNLVSNLLYKMSAPHLGFEPFGFNSYSTIASNISLFSAVFIGIAVIIWGLRYFVMRNKIQISQQTWGCGYVVPNTKMQYTAKSFSKPLGKILNFLLIEKKQFEEIKPGEIFPSKRNYVSNYFDFFEHRFISNITKRLVYTVNYFKFIQNGMIQSYVIYGIVFIVVIFVITALSIIK